VILQYNIEINNTQTLASYTVRCYTKDAIYLLNIVSVHEVQKIKTKKIK